MIKNRRKIENFVLKNAAIMTVSEMVRVVGVSSSTINRSLSAVFFVKIGEFCKSFHFS